MEEFQLKKQTLKEDKIVQQMKDHIQSKNLSSKFSKGNMAISETIIDEAIRNGLNGKKNAIYNAVINSIKNANPSLDKEIQKLRTQKRDFNSSNKYSDKALKLNKKSKQLDEEIEKSHSKISMKNRHIGILKEEKNTLSKDGEEVSTTSTRLGVKGEKLKMGQRNNSQKLLYQSAHQSKCTFISASTEALAEKDEAGENISKVSNKLKESVVKPFVRKHVPGGFDRHQHRERKLTEKQLKTERKITKLSNKSTVKEVYSNTSLKSNPITRAFQKRKIRKNIYAQSKRRRGMGTGLKGAVTAPFKAVKNIGAIVSATISGLMLFIQSTVAGALIIIVVVVPVVIFLNMFSIFFGLLDSSKDPRLVETEQSVIYSDYITSLQRSLVIADENDSNWKKKTTDGETQFLGMFGGESMYDFSDMYTDYSDLDEVYLDYSSINAVNHKRSQIKFIAMLAATYNDEITLSKTRDEVRELIENLYYVNEDYVERKEEKCTTWFDEHGEAWEHCYDVYYYDLYLRLEVGNLDDYIQNKLDTAEDPELSNLLYDNYMEMYGLNQVIISPFEDQSWDWRRWVSAEYGYRSIEVLGYSYNAHGGLDIGTGGRKLSLVAGADARIVYAGWEPGAGWSINYEIDDPNEKGKKLTVRYIHCSSVREDLVGQEVPKGTVIAVSGGTGTGSGASATDTTLNVRYHLHVEISKGTHDKPGSAGGGNLYNNIGLNPLFYMEFPTE